METRIALIGGLVGLLLACSLRPLRAAAAMLALLASWAGLMAWAISAEFLPDPTGPPAIALGAFAVTALVRAARDDWRTRRLRASFEQYLAPDVVRRIAADPTALRLAGEQREITALFTDIEGFTSLTERATPADLVALLDAYFDMAGRIVTTHGGMVDKIVGDAVTAIFNAPFDLPDHPARALDCALALQAGAEELRHASLGQKLGLGPTRIGLETGPAIVGDIGGSRKLDYTAYGNVMNTAARLEAANKEFRARICVGPTAATRISPARLRPLGTLTPRGQSRALEVFTPIQG
jgi:adenylate cyclase